MGHSSDINQLGRIWQEAALDLGLEVESPFTLGSGPTAVTCVAWVKHFGSSAGAAVGLIHVQQAEVSRLAKSLGMYVSFLNPEVYGSFDRQLFIETLLDWGWFGPSDEAPSWYKALIPPGNS